MFSMKKVVVYNVFDSEAPDIRTVIHDKKRLILINCSQLLLLAKNLSHFALHGNRKLTLQTTRHIKVFRCFG